MGKSFLRTEKETKRAVCLTHHRAKKRHECETKTKENLFKVKSRWDTQQEKSIEVNWESKKAK